VVQGGRDDRAVGVEGQPGGSVLVPGLPGGLQVLLPVFHPLDRGGQPAGRQEQADVLAQRHDLLPEAAADVPGDHPHLVLGHAEQPRREHPHLVRGLGGRPDRQLAAAARPLRHQAAGLHRDGGVRLLPDRLGDHVRRGVIDLGDGLPGGTAELAREVAGIRLVHEGGRGAGGGVVGDRGQRLVADVHQFGGVLGYVPAVRDDQRDRIARETRLALGERRPRRIRHRLPGAGVPGFAHVGVEVGGGEDGVHAGQPERGGRVDAGDARPGVRAADEAGMQHARAGDVIDEGARAGQQPCVLDAVHPAAGVASRPNGGHDSPLPVSSADQQGQPFPAAHRRRVL
jgi:hypothetical protein